jgi:hypothetical protein
MEDAIEQNKKTMPLVNNSEEELELYRAMFRKSPYYMFLINTKVEVLLTNYYDLNPDMPKSVPIILGNILHCKNGCDAGVCGMHDACKSCIVRASILKAFQNSENFENLEAHMKLYNKKMESIDTYVLVNGSVMQVQGQCYMLVSVRDITTFKAVQRRLIENEYKLNHFVRDSELYLKLIHENYDIDGVQSEIARQNKSNGKISLIEMHEKISAPIVSSLPSILVVTKNEDTFSSIKDFIGRSYQLMRATTFEEALTTYLNLKVDAIIIAADIDMNEANMLTESIHCSRGHQRVLRIINNAGDSAGTYDVLIDGTFTQKQLLDALKAFKI